MKRTTLISLFLLAAVLVSLPAFGVSRVRAANGYEMRWWTIDNGGGSSAGVAYDLTGTIGQADTGRTQGGDYILNGGFWVRGVLDLLDFIIHLPLVLK